MRDPKTFTFADDGHVPNNPWPLLIYPGAVDVAGDSEARFEKLFAANGWGQDLWRDGIFDFTHYHATVHEVLGIARGSAEVQFGGEHGEALVVKAGDVAVLPAGTGHRRLNATKDFRVVGGYPPGARMQVTRPSPAEHAKALQTIPRVGSPDSDPVFGANGPLTRLWRQALTPSSPR